jgi:hypothetical protein
MIIANTRSRLSVISIVDVLPFNLFNTPLQLQSPAFARRHSTWQNKKDPADHEDRCEGISGLCVSFRLHAAHLIRR